MAFRTLDEAELAGKRALVRVDFNVPMADGAGHRRHPPARRAADHRAAARRRRQGDPARPLRPAQGRTGSPHEPRPDRRRRCRRCSDAPVRLRRRLHRRAGARAPSRRWRPATSLCSRTCASIRARRRTIRPSPPPWPPTAISIVDDAFSAAHRAHASTEAIAHLLPAFAGEAMRRELDALEAALGTPKRPVLGIVGGSKVSTKLDLLTTSSPSSTTWPSAAAWPTPSSSPRATTSAPPSPRRTSPTRPAYRRRGRSEGAANCCCPSTSSSPNAWKPGALADLRPDERGAQGPHPRRGTRDRRAAERRHGRRPHPDLERSPGGVRNSAIRRGDDGRRTSRRRFGEGRFR